MKADWRAEADGISLGHGWAMFRGLAGDNQAHAHHAVQVAIARGSLIRVDLGAEGPPVKAPGVIIGSGVVHRLLPNPDPVQLLYLDPSHHLGQQLHTRTESGVHVLGAATSSALHGAMVATTSVPPWATLVQQLKLEPSPPTTLHPALRRVLKTLDQQLDKPLRIQQVADTMHCSASHAARLFKNHVGLPLRAYLRWRRLILAIHAVARGADLTHAAAEAGFSDSAHLSRTMRQTFGVEARTLLKLGLSPPSSD